ncbi:glycosyl transferase family protein [Poseidonocella sp. HB161398]|uniref:glycosyl transferase family protein n=1 Tax=Poseidonocella sp. HB161398 TaxID=2320855 RepID=UPI0011099764|nr:glycosyl transferase family protein [Poseidonocella sp. HB161398]
MTSLAHLVRALGRGPGRSRNLDRKEAQEAMAAILDGTAPPEAVGALLMLMRYRGETGEEIAGFVDAMRARLKPWATLPATLDWPSYAAGRSRGLPLFLLAARLVAMSGQRVLLHGWNSHQNPHAEIRAHLGEAGIPAATTLDGAKTALERNHIVYVPLEAMDPELLRVLKLRDLLGLRSPVNTALRSMNPSGAPASVLGVFHPPYRGLQQDAAALLGERNLMVIKGGGGEFERHPAKQILVYGLEDGAVHEQTVEPLIDDTRRLADAEPQKGDLGRLWSGEREDAFARATVTGTAALALLAAGGATTLAGAQARMDALWEDRLVPAG